MKEKKWKIEYKDEPWHSIINGTSYTHQGYYKITFDGLLYGSFSKTIWDEMVTGEIMKTVEQMLNDAHDLAMQEKA